MNDYEKSCRCRVCAYLFSGPVWEFNEAPTFDICPACGCEAGLDDDTLESTREYRQAWINGGMQWWSSGGSQPPPPDWDPIEQMKNLPSEWK